MPRTVPKKKHSTTQHHKNIGFLAKLKKSVREMDAKIAEQQAILLARKAEFELTSESQEDLVVVDEGAEEGGEGGDGGGVALWQRVVLASRERRRTGR